MRGGRAENKEVGTFKNNDISHSILAIYPSPLAFSSSFKNIMRIALSNRPASHKYESINP